MTHGGGSPSGSIEGPLESTAAGGQGAHVPGKGGYNFRKRRTPVPGNLHTASPSKKGDKTGAVHGSPRPDVPPAPESDHHHGLTPPSRPPPVPSPAPRPGPAPGPAARHVYFAEPDSPPREKKAWPPGKALHREMLIGEIQQATPAPAPAAAGGGSVDPEVQRLRRQLTDEMAASRQLAGKLREFEDERTRELRDLTCAMDTLRDKERQLEGLISKQRTLRQEELQESKSRTRRKVEELEHALADLTGECDLAKVALRERTDAMGRLRADVASKSAEVKALTEVLGVVKTELAALQRNGFSTQLRYATALKDVQGQLQSLRASFVALSAEAREAVRPSMVGEAMASSVAAAMQRLVAEHEEVKRRYAHESAERRKFYNQVLELKGNIRVFCRCRPLSDQEVTAGQANVVEVDGAKGSSSGATDLSIRGGARSADRKQFKFDRVFGAESTQGEVFADTAPVVMSVLDGFNVCIFAYGQTGTGKTFTMEGSPTERGVNYRTLEELFRIISARSAEAAYDVRVSVLEVYNEQIRDLLTPADGRVPHKKLEVKQGPQGNHVPGLTEAHVATADEAWEVLQTGAHNRSVGATNSNEHSSRSHCMLCVSVKADNFIAGEATQSRLWLVDLAGSERVGRSEASGDRLKEAQAINKSLSALGDVIQALTTKSQHVPFRNSKLTHLLADSLGGDSKALMFVQISPAEADAGETLCSLQFASRVRGVELGPAKRQVDTSELFKWKQMVAAGKQEAKVREEALHRLEGEVHDLEAKLKAKDGLCSALGEKLRQRESALGDVEERLVSERKGLLEARASAEAARRELAALRKEVRGDNTGASAMPRHNTDHAVVAGPAVAAGPTLATERLLQKPPGRDTGPLPRSNVEFSGPSLRLGGDLIRHSADPGGSSSQNRLGKGASDVAASGAFGSVQDVACANQSMELDSDLSTRANDGSATLASRDSSSGVEFGKMAGRLLHGSSTVQGGGVYTDGGVSLSDGVFTAGVSSLASGQRDNQASGGWTGKMASGVESGLREGAAQTATPLRGMELAMVFQATLPSPQRATAPGARSLLSDGRAGGAPMAPKLEGVAAGLGSGGSGRDPAVDQHTGEQDRGGLRSAARGRTLAWLKIGRGGEACDLAHSMPPSSILAPKEGSASGPREVGTAGLADGGSKFERRLTWNENIDPAQLIGASTTMEPGSLAGATPRGPTASVRAKAVPARFQGVGTPARVRQGGKPPVGPAHMAQLAKLKGMVSEQGSRAGGGTPMRGPEDRVSGGMTDVLSDRLTNLDLNTPDANLGAGVGSSTTIIPILERKLTSTAIRGGGTTTGARSPLSGVKQNRGGDYVDRFEEYKKRKAVDAEGVVAVPSGNQSMPVDVRPRAGRTVVLTKVPSIGSGAQRIRSGARRAPLKVPTVLGDNSNGKPKEIWLREKMWNN